MNHMRFMAAILVVLAAVLAARVDTARACSCVQPDPRNDAPAGRRSVRGEARQAGATPVRPVTVHLRRRAIGEGRDRQDDRGGRLRRTVRPAASRQPWGSGSG